MAEIEFLDAVAAYLATAVAPAAPVIGVVEPSAAADLPAVVLALEQTSRAGMGLGQRSALVRGALAWQARIDLAAPFLHDDASFALLDATRRELVLPHGGLVKREGDEGPLAAADIAVTVAGAPRALVAAAPVGDQFTADGAVGRLAFGTALPATGLLVADYFVGQWEQRLVRITGVLRADVLAATAASTTALVGAVIAGLTAAAARVELRGLLALDITGVSSVSVPLQDHAGARRQSLRAAFTYEHEINRPESSGGVIGSIPVQANLVSQSNGSAGP